MKKLLKKRILTLGDINNRILLTPTAFIQEENQRYFQEVKALTKELTQTSSGRRLVMLSGPSSSGKTTTALLLRDFLRAQGVDAHTVSLDDFYRGLELAPLLPNGQYDYEALEALDLQRLQICMRDIIKTGVTALPLFDFKTGRPAPHTRELRVAPNSVVIFEGIHALNPIFEQHLPQGNVLKLFINTISPVYEEENKLLARRDIRLIRRLLRDERFRSSPIVNTLEMWQQVMRGENKYMFPYVDTVDVMLDTTHAYEPCVFAGELLPRLREVPSNNPYIKTVHHLMEALEKFAVLSQELVPRDTLLREFLGDGLY